MLINFPCPEYFLQKSMMQKKFEIDGHHNIPQKTSGLLSHFYVIIIDMRLSIDQLSLYTNFLNTIRYTGLKAIGF